MRGPRPLTRWLEIAVPAHAEAVEAVSEILTRIGHNGIAVDMPTVGAGGRGAETGDYTVKAYLLADADAFAKVSVRVGSLAACASGQGRTSRSAAFMPLRVDTSWSSQSCLS